MEAIQYTSCSQILVFTLLLIHASGVHPSIFGAAQSYCSNDDECPTFGRTKCVGPSFGICLTGQVNYFSIPGKCIRRGNIACRLKVLLNGEDQSECDYYRCAQCLNNLDCTDITQMCSSFRCVYRRGKEKHGLFFQHYLQKRF